MNQRSVYTASSMLNQEFFIINIVFVNVHIIIFNLVQNKGWFYIMKRLSPGITGVLWMVSSSILFSFMAVFVRYANSFYNLSGWKTSEMRFAVCIMIILVLSLSKKYPLKFVNCSWLASRGIFGGAAVCIFFYTINKIGMAKATVLTFTYPLWAAVLSPLLFKKPVSIGIWIAIIAASIGLYLIVIPPEGIDSISLMDLLALFAGLLSGWAILSIKKLHETDSSRAILFSQCLFGLMFAIVPSAKEGYSFPAGAWGMLVLIGVVAAAAQLQMTHAYKFVGAAEGSLISILNPVLNVFLGVIFFKEPLTLRMFFGCAIVFACCVYAAIPGGYEREC
jgi:drug/metabolite transporter (DMT)-like permease